MRSRASFSPVRFARGVLPLFCFSAIVLASARAVQAPRDQTAAKTIEVEYREVDAHRIGDPPFIRASGYQTDRLEIFPSMSF
jgi:hypothetical protein